MPINVAKQPLYDPADYPYPKWVTPPAVNGNPAEAVIVNSEAEEARALAGKHVPQPPPESTAPAVFGAPPPPYEHQEYPKWIDGVLVHSQEEEEDLLTAPAAPVNTAVIENAEADERVMLMRMAEQKRVKADGRWSLAKLRDIVMAAPDVEGEAA